MANRAIIPGFFLPSNRQFIVIITLTHANIIVGTESNEKTHKIKTTHCTTDVGFSLLV